MGGDNKLKKRESSGNRKTEVIKMCENTDESTNRNNPRGVSPAHTAVDQRCLLEVS